MNKFSVLIFSKRGMEEAADLIKDLNDIADDIVLISGSAASVKNASVGKVRVFYTVPLGYPDPFRTYGVQKCKYNWILHLDTDERLSDKLKRDIKNIISSTHASAFALKRIEKGDSVKRKLFTWQVRLFRKDKVDFNGVIHNLPIVTGKTAKLDPDSYFSEHNEESNEGNKINRYLTIEAYTRRFSYNDVLALAQERELPTFPLKAYLKLKMANLSSQLSKFDYNSFLFLYSAIIYLSKFSKSSYIGWGGGFRYTYDYNKRKIVYFFNFSPKEQELQFDISQEIVAARGVINYLGLNNDHIIRVINKKFIHSDIKGMELFIYLLKKRYQNGKDYFKRL